ncbi:MAG: dihydroneopterin aldolase [Candidatus Cloacimonetes bacterium]|nr:dihydroneopterin aldolase [Candidatus Cloacimonadota bacterium]
MKIYLNEMVFYGYHGVKHEERVLGQRFIVNLIIETASETDSQIHHLHDTVDYTRIYDEVKHTMEKKQFHLLEDCANEILDAIFNNFDKVVAAEVKIKKPSVPINGSLGSVEIEMNRRR